MYMTNKTRTHQSNKCQVKINLLRVNRKKKEEKKTQIQNWCFLIQNSSSFTFCLFVPLLKKITPFSVSAVFKLDAIELYTLDLIWTEESVCITMKWMRTFISKMWRILHPTSTFTIHHPTFPTIGIERKKQVGTGASTCSIYFQDFVSSVLQNQEEELYVIITQGPFNVSK